MRLRLPELLDEKKVSPYRLSLLSGDRISMSTAYRLKRERGKLQSFKSDMLDALCDVLKVTPGELWERDNLAPAPKTKRPPTPDKPAVAKRKNSRAA